jgi:prophage antirepressor-like protein
MSNQLETFKFEGANVQVIKDENNAPWFLAKDICAILGYSNSRDAVKTHCKEKGVVKRDTLTSGGNQELTYINEGNFYRLVVKSNKPEAERFESWVCDEVLVEIRKTDSYSVNKRKSQPTAILPSVAKEMRAALQIAKMLGLKDNQAKLHADEATQKVTGQSPIKLLGIELTSPNQERHFTPTELAKMTGFKSAIAFNKELEAKGYQEKITISKDKWYWNPTKKGEQFAVLLDRPKAHAHGTVQQLEWRESIKHELSKTNAGGTAHV